MRANDEGAQKANQRVRRFFADDNRRVRPYAAYAVAFFSCALGSSPLGELPLLGEQAQPVSRLKQFTKAFHHFFQKLGTLSAFAFVVVIAFQVFDCSMRAGRKDS